METNKRNSLHLSGIVGGAGGGMYDMVSINGQGNIKGNLDCNQFTCNGTATLRGNLKAQRAEVHGYASISGMVEAGHFAIHGKTVLEQSFRGESMQVHGFLTLRGDCTVEQFRSQGGFRIDGLLNAERIELDLFAECRVREIGGETVEVRRMGNSNMFGKLLKVFMPNHEMLCVEMIEGDHIHLEHTRADIVRGAHVTIGPGCVIGTIEYRDTCDIDPESKVREHKHV